jgi:hypothetical protein
MVRKIGLVSSILLLAVAVSTSVVLAQGPRNIRETLSGYQETPQTISTAGNGEFRARIGNDDQSIGYELSYRQLEGNVLQAHIHFGREATSGGISVFLCTNLGNGPAGTQACPPAPATISGTIRPADVIGPVGQGIAAGEFGELLRAVRAGATYVNVHSSLYPTGEIRAQLNHDNHGNQGPGGGRD